MNPTSPPKDRTADARAGLIMARLSGADDSIRLPADEKNLDLFRRWVRSELIVDPRATNRTSASSVSIVPLHSGVTRYFTLLGNQPAYGRFICELLARHDTGLNFHILENLSERFDESTDGDPVNAIIGIALDSENTSSKERRFRRIESHQQQVLAIEHASLFQRQIESALAYSTVVRRKTLVDWLYSLTTLFVATYFLRMARASRSYARWIENVFAGVTEPWGKSVDDPEFAPSMPYAHRDENHAQLLKQLPLFTSQIAVAQAFVQAADAESAPDRSDLEALGDAVTAITATVDAAEVFRSVVTFIRRSKRTLEDGGCLPRRRETLFRWPARLK